MLVPLRGPFSGFDLRKGDWRAPSRSVEVRQIGVIVMVFLACFLTWFSRTPQKAAGGGGMYFVTADKGCGNWQGRP